MSTPPDKHFRWDGKGPLFIGDLAPGQRTVIEVRLSEIIEQLPPGPPPGPPSLGFLWRPATRWWPTK